MYISTILQCIHLWIYIVHAQAVDKYILGVGWNYTMFYYIYILNIHFTRLHILNKLFQLNFNVLSYS